VHEGFLARKHSPSTDVIDLHYQSTKTFTAVLDAVLQESLQAHAQVWVVTGTGHHTAVGHQKAGALAQAVQAYLDWWGYDYSTGKDSQGKSGSFLVAGGS
jgi:DNA-nicking Smr family endonuclease